MDKRTQDLIWSILSKEDRDKERRGFATPSSNEYSHGYDNARKIIFGHHNLTSDSEPEELLFVERKKVQEVYKTSQEILNNESYGSKMYSMHLQIMCVLENLFGDKCLPDTPNTPNSGELKCDKDISKMEISTTEDDKELEHRLEQTSVQGEPKKYFESDYCTGDKVIIAISSIGNPRKEVVTLLRQYQPQCEYNEYTKTWVVQTQDGMTYQSNEEHFEPYD